MNSSKRKAVTPSKSRLARIFAKVLHVRTATGITPVDGFLKPKSEEKIREANTGNKIKVDRGSSAGDRRLKSNDLEQEEWRNRVVGFQRSKSEEKIRQVKVHKKKVDRANTIGDRRLESHDLDNLDNDELKNKVEGFQKPKSVEKFREFNNVHKIKVDKGSFGGVGQLKSHDPENEECKNRVAVEAFLARIFACISSIKAAYAQLQLAQSPYDGEGIQASDREVVSQLKALSELKHCYAKKQFDAFPEEVLISAEIQEQKSVLKTYEVMKSKLGAQLQLKDSEITFLREKLEESKKENRLLERTLNESGQLSVPDNLHLSGLSPNHFIPVLRHTVRSVRSFVKLMIGEMQSSGWDLDAAATAIQPGVTYWKEDHKCFAFESFICREMFHGFDHPNFSLPNESVPEAKHRRRIFFERFIELKSVKAKDYLSLKPKSTFGKFCRAKYLKLVHPKMESSFFGNLNLRNMVISGEFPDTPFFFNYAEMAKRVWLLHCLAFSFDSPAKMFQIKRNCRFSEVFMESVADEAIIESNGGSKEAVVHEPSVGFTVVPGFKIGKTVVQCQVYISRS